MFSSSRLLVGSSAMIILGLLDSALMTAIRCLSPPLRLSGQPFFFSQNESLSDFLNAS